MERFWRETQQSSAKLSRAHQGATRDLTNLENLENFWRESLNKTESHKTDNEMYTEIWKCKTLGRIWMDKKYRNEDTFFKCGQKHLPTKHTAYETAYKIKTMQVAHKDTFFKTPAHFGGVQGIKMSKEDFLWERWKWE